MTTSPKKRLRSKRVLPFALARVRRDACRLEAIALLLLYVGGIVVVPGVHKATIRGSCFSHAPQASVVTDNAPVEVAVTPPAGESPDHDPLTCPICQLAAAPQIAGNSTPPLTAWHVIVTTVPVTARAYHERLQSDPHRARGPPSPS
jgi:hypothetical protein